MDDLSRMLEGMMQGVSDEMDEVRRSDAGRVWDLRDGCRIEGGRGPEVEYAFRVGGGKPPLLGQVGSLSVGEESVQATVSGKRPGVLSLLCAQDLGAEVEEATLFVRDDLLLARLHDQLRGLSRDVPSESLAHRLVAGGAPVAVPLTPDLGREDTEGLNLCQATAVREALKQDITWLWGPPGTGKTSTAAAVAGAWIRRGQSVLLTAPTNRAVDHLLDRVASDPRFTDLILQGRVLRVGSMDEEAGEEEPTSPLFLQAVVRRLAAPLQQRFREIEEELRLLEEDASKEPGASGRRAILETERRSIDAELERLPRHLLENAQVVATTVHRSALGQLGRRFDCAVLDEASMVSVPWALAACTQVRERILAAGDPNQLGPVVRSDSVYAQEWLGRAPLQTFRTGSPGRVMLTEQYRMHPELCEVVGTLSYGGQLTTAISVDRPTLSSRLPGPLIHIDTSGRGGRCRRPDRGGSRVNPRQADLVASLVRQLRDDMPGKLIAVVTPYTAQASLLARRMEALRVRGPLRVGTVHVLQGSSAPVVVLDLPDAPGLPPSGFMRARSPSDAGARLLTVAISRAEHHLIVLGDLHWLARVVPRDGVLLEFLQLLQRHGAPLQTLARGAGAFHHGMGAPGPADSNAKPRRRKC